MVPPTLAALFHLVQHGHTHLESRVLLDILPSKVISNWHGKDGKIYTLSAGYHNDISTFQIKSGPEVKGVPQFHGVARRVLLARTALLFTCFHKHISVGT